MAIIQLPAGVTTQIHVGGAGAIAFANQAGYNILLNTTDPLTDGGVVRLSGGDTLWLAANSPEAAKTWFAVCPIDARIVVTDFT